jgi:hypothetical protein
VTRIAPDRYGCEIPVAMEPTSKILVSSNTGQIFNVASVVISGKFRISFRARGREHNKVAGGRSKKDQGIG